MDPLYEVVAGGCFTIYRASENICFQYVDPDKDDHLIISFVVKSSTRSSFTEAIWSFVV